MKACKFEEQRLAPRERIALPLKLRDGLQATIRDISSTGLFFEMEGEHRLADLADLGLVDFELHLVDARVKITSAGQIIRIDYGAGRTGVAVRLIAPRLEPVE